MSWVTDRIAVSSQWQLFNESRLVEKGITHVLVVARDLRVPAYERLAVAKFAWWDNKNLDELYEAIYFIDQAVVDGKVLVACVAGLERSPLTVIAYFIWKGYSLVDAVNEVVKRRPQTMLHVEWLRDIGFLTY